MRTRALLTSTLLLAALGAASCSVSGSVEVGKFVDSATLEKQVATELQKQLPPDSVSCPDGLKGKVGAKSICTVIADDLQYTATVTATKVDGSTVKFDVKMPPPATVPQASLEKQVGDALADQVPGGLDSVECDGDLEGTVDETASCDVLTQGGESLPVTVTVTTATFTDVRFSIRSTE
jgi:hypothetical protein